MKTLKSYDLQRGDWVNFGAKWSEFHEFSEVKFVAFFYDDVGRDINTPVQAVLRPSVIIRDELEGALKYLRSPDYNPERGSLPAGSEIIFTEIHPKERKKSLKEKCSLNYPMDALDVFNAFHLLCEEIEALKRGDK